MGPPINLGKQDGKMRAAPNAPPPQKKTTPSPYLPSHLFSQLLAVERSLQDMVILPARCSSLFLAWQRSRIYGKLPARVRSNQ